MRLTAKKKSLAAFHFGVVILCVAVGMIIFSSFSSGKIWEGKNSKLLSEATNESTSKKSKEKDSKEREFISFMLNNYYRHLNDIF